MNQQRIAARRNSINFWNQKETKIRAIKIIILKPKINWTSKRLKIIIFRPKINWTSKRPKLKKPKKSFLLTVMEISWDCRFLCTASSLNFMAALYRKFIVVQNFSIHKKWNPAFTVWIIEKNEKNEFFIAKKMNRSIDRSIIRMVWCGMEWCVNQLIATGLNSHG